MYRYTFSIYPEEHNARLTISDKYGGRSRKVPFSEKHQKEVEEIIIKYTILSTKSICELKSVFDEIFASVVETKEVPYSPSRGEIKVTDSHSNGQRKRAIQFCGENPQIKRIDFVYEA